MDDSVTKAQLAPAGGEGGLVGGAVDGGPGHEAVGFLLPEPDHPMVSNNLFLLLLKHYF